MGREIRRGGEGDKERGGGEKKRGEEGDKEGWGRR